MGRLAWIGDAWAALIGAENGLHSLRKVSPPIYLLEGVDEDAGAEPGSGVLRKVQLGNVALASGRSRQHTEVDEFVAVLSACVVRT